MDIANDIPVVVYYDDNATDVRYNRCIFKVTSSYIAYNCVFIHTTLKYIWCQDYKYFTVIVTSY